MVVMDSGSFAEPVIGPASGRTRWLMPRNDKLLRSIILPDYFTWAGFLTEG
jgi:hypothetical protein